MADEMALNGNPGAGRPRQEAGVFFGPTRPPRPDLYRSVTDSPSRVLAKHAERLRIGTGPLRLQVYENAVLVPEQGLLGAGGETLPDGQLRRLGNRVPAKGLERVDVVAPEHVIDGEALFAGWMFDHFGHFLTESLGRSWAMPLAGRGMPILCLCTPPDLPGNSAGWLDVLGLDPGRFEVPRVPTLVRRLIVPDACLEIGTYAHERAAEALQVMGDRLDDGQAMTGQPLYLSRAGLTTRRRLQGEAVFEEYLRREGFRVIRPETLPLAEQIAIIRRHRVIVGPRGSAFHLALFTRHHPTMHLLSEPPPVGYGNYLMMADVLDAPAVFVACCRLPEAGDTGAGGLPFDRIMAAEHLRREGLVRRPGMLHDLIRAESAVAAGAEVGR